jgi:hypothetical protein
MMHLMQILIFTGMYVYSAYIRHVCTEYLYLQRSKIEAHVVLIFASILRSLDPRLYVSAESRQSIALIERFEISANWELA